MTRERGRQRDRRRQKEKQTRRGRERYRRYACCIIHDDECKFDLSDKLTRERGRQTEGDRKRDRQEGEKIDICMYAVSYMMMIVNMTW